jgi:flagellar biogenesis protein FliO
MVVEKKSILLIINIEFETLLCQVHQVEIQTLSPLCTLVETHTDYRVRDREVAKLEALKRRSQQLFQSNLDRILEQQRSSLVSHI